MNSGQSGKVPRLAVSAILRCGDEIFVVRRTPEMKAFPGYFAFPGGKVDEAEPYTETLQTLMQKAGEGFDERTMPALQREMQEELNIDLNQMCSDGEIRAISYVGCAITPKFVPTRFATHFFVVDLKHKPDLDVDEGEVMGFGWDSAQNWKERDLSGRMLCVPPTRALLHWLAGQPANQPISAPPDLDFTAGLASQSADHPIWVEPLNGLRQVFVPSHTLPPAQYTNAFWFGQGEQKTVVDPSPKSDADYARLLDLLKGWGVNQIFITHHHPDHRERADDLARELKVPMLMSKTTHHFLQKRSRKNFFENVEVKLITDGETVSRWQGEKVTAIAVPGHDAGQLALMPESKQWCLVSDLYQGVGTVVVGGEEGNMADYFRSLQKIIDLDPDVLIPSHGPASGTTYRIKYTLQHRQQREQQILELAQNNADLPTMLRKIYPVLPEGLIPFAQLNIESHLEKLRQEQRI